MLFSPAISHPWWEPSAPENVKPVPFLHPRVVAYLESLLQPDWRILEHGSGGSTLWFAERCEWVVAIENNQEWFDVIVKNYIHKPIEMVKPSHEFTYKFDLFLIDGEPLEDRANHILHSVDLVKPGGIVVLDNANREEYAKERKWLQDNCERFETFDCNDDVSKYMVTEFYFLKG